MFTWQGDDGRALESVRVLLGGTGLRALGRMVRAPLDGPAFTASYRLFADETGVLSRLSVTSTTSERERNLTLNHTEDGYWLLDTGSADGGGPRAEFDGALDVDLAYSPLFNALPVRRLGLHRQPGDQVLPMVFVSLPTLEVTLVSQRYRTVATLDGDRARVNFSSDVFSADLLIDADGMVVDYPDLAKRL